MAEEVDNSAKLAGTVAIIRQRWSCTPKFAVILGTGLGEFVEGLAIEASIPYAELPGFCPTTAVGHAGEFVCGKIDSIPVVALRGRSHCYEGVSREEITFPVRVLKQLGVETLIVSCAAGGLAPSFQAGEMMLIEDQIDFLYPRTLSSQQRHHRLNQPLYNESLRQKISGISRLLNIPLRSGTYISVTGPNYETRAEMRFYRGLGDAIGMSTVPEVALAKQIGMQVLGLATITNLCNPDTLIGADGDHVVCVASETEPSFRKLVVELIRSDTIG